MSSQGLGRPRHSALRLRRTSQSGCGSRLCAPGARAEGGGRAAAPQCVCLRAAPACPPGDPRAQAPHGGDKGPRRPERLPWEGRAGTPRATAMPSASRDTGPQGSGARCWSHSPETPSSWHGVPARLHAALCPRAFTAPAPPLSQGSPTLGQHPNRSLQRRGVWILYCSGGAHLPQGSGTGCKGGVGRRVVPETKGLLGVIWWLRKSPGQRRPGGASH